MKLKLNQIVTNPEQPRKYFDEEKLSELAASIKIDGLQEPILVRPIKDEKYEIVQGERRFRAHQLNGMEEIEVKIRELNDNEAFHLAVIENIQREQLTPIEEAQAYLKYVEMGYTHEQIAKKVSKSRTHVTTRLRLLKLLPFIQDWIAEGYLSEGHAKQILKMEGFLNRILKNKPVNKYQKVIDGEVFEESHFEDFQRKFHGVFWEKHGIKKEKLTVNEVKQWVDYYRYSLINSTILQYQGMGNCIVSINRGLPLTAELDCCINYLHISNIIEDDIDFAITFDMERYKDIFTRTFRPWMVEKYWDDVRTELFHSDIDIKEKWKLNSFGDVITKAKEYKQVLKRVQEPLGNKSLNIITEELKFYQTKLEEISSQNGISVEELIDEITQNVSHDTF